MIKVYCEQGSEAWHQAKLGVISGTRFKSLMSAKSTQGYKDLVLTIAGEIITQEKEETYSNDIMERGIELEPQAVKVYEEEFGIKTEEIGFCIPDNNEWIGVSPDRLVGIDGGLEIKCPLLKTHLGYIKANKLPATYRHQVQACLYVTGCKWWDFMSYYPGVKPFIIRIFPDLDLHQEFNVRINEVIEEIRVLIESYNNYDHLL